MAAMKNGGAQTLALLDISFFFHFPKALLREPSSAAEKMIYCISGFFLVHFLICFRPPDSEAYEDPTLLA